MNFIKKTSALLVTLCAVFALTMSAAAEAAPQIDPVLILSPEAELTVAVDGAVSSELSDRVPYGESVTLTAPEKAGSNSFRCWTNNSGEIISYARNLSLTMYASTTLNAVYGASAANPANLAAFTSISRIGESIAFCGIGYAATGEVSEAGVLYSTTANTLSALQALTPDGTIEKSGSCWTLLITPENENTTYYAVAYAKVGDQTYYSTVKTVKLSELQSGVSLIANLGEIDLSQIDAKFCVVTFEANGGEGIMTPQGVVKDAATVLNANTFTREGYTFSGWSKEEKGGGTTYTDGQSVTLSANTTLYAVWSSGNGGGNGGSGGSGGGSGGSSSGTATTVTVPVTGDSGTVSVSVSVKDKDATVAPLTEEQVDSIVGTGSTASTVEIDASSLGKEITTVTIPADTVKVIEAAVSDKTKDADSLTVKLTEGSITFDADAVKAITEETKSDGLKVNLDDIGTEKLNTAQKSAVSDLAVETVLDAYVTSGSTRISDFKGGSATVSVKHTLKAAQSPAGIVVWYVADDGTRTQIPASFRGGEVVFTVMHFSNYVIAYDAEKAAAAGKLDWFIDLDSSAWYADGVLWAVDNGVMNGWANPLDAGMLFGPNDTTTRAMVATMLWRLEGSPVVSGEMKFVDVAEGTWYTEAVRWAASVGIISGSKIPAETTPWPMGFCPNDAVTREQLAAMLYRYAQYKKADVSASASLSGYGDASDVSVWATDAMQWAVGSGIINGIGSNLIPAGNATRAQVATMLMRYSSAK